MTESFRYDQPVKVWFGGAEITIAPLKGLERLHAFERAVAEEISSLSERVEGHVRSGTRVSAEALLETGIDEARLLKLGAPDQITDELLAESTARERLGALRDICYANNLGRLAPFLSLEALIDVASRLNQQLPDFPLPASNGNSSEPVSAGTTSSTS